MNDDGYRGLRLPNEPAGTPGDGNPRPSWLSIPRLDHGLLFAGAAVMAVGAQMPWLQGSTRLRGYIDWTGLNDTGEGFMIVTCGLIAVAFVRWRGALEGIDPRFRWTAFIAGLAALALWVIGLQKALYLAWWDLEVGAKPRIGLLVTGVGVALTLAGGWLAARRRANPEIVEMARRRKAQTEPPSAFDREGRVGADGYAVRGRIDPRGPRDG